MRSNRGIGPRQQTPRQPHSVSWRKRPERPTRASAHSAAYSFRPDVEGLRGVAVLLVVFFHAGLTVLRGGFIGVDVFFVLSGYLITGLLVQEWERTDSIHLSGFYARRARRLLPATALVTLVVLLAGVLLASPLNLADIAKSARATAAYLSNVRFMLGATDYFATSNETNPLLHTWSLAVEEQFYLFWPFLLWFGMRGARSRARLTSFIIAVTLVSFAGCLWLTRARQPWAFFGSPVRAWEFGIGALAYLIPPAVLQSRPRLSVAIGAVGLLVVCASGSVLTERVAFPGLAALPPVLGTSAVLIAGVGAPGAGVGRLLGTAPLQYLGRLSYSWYLWHWPVLVFAAEWFGKLSTAESLAAVGLSLGLASLAYRAVENPIRFQPRLLAAPASRSLWLAAAVTGGLIVIATGTLKVALRESERWPYRNLAKIAADRGRIYDDGCMVPFQEASPIACTYGDPVSSFVVVAFGDSHTAQWFPAMEMLAKEHAWRLVYFIKSGCPSADVPIYNRFLKRVEPECAEWRTRVLTRIRELQPRLVVLSNSSVYVKRPGVRDASASLTVAQWRQGIRRTAARLDSTGAKILLIRDTPRPEADIPLCLARAARRPRQSGESCSTSRDQALNENVYRAEVVALAGLANASSVDLTSHFCNDTMCNAVRDGIVVYRDDSHITPTFARSLAPELGQALGCTLAIERLNVPHGDYTTLHTDKRVEQQCVTEGKEVPFVVYGGWVRPPIGLRTGNPLAPRSATASESANRLETPQ